MFPICVWQRAVPIQKWFSIVGLTTAKCWQARVSQRVSQSLLIFHFLRLALPKLYIYTQTNFSASSDLYIEYMYVCTWFLDLGELQLCAHILGSLAFKEFARENNVLLKMPSFIWCGNFLCRNILLETIVNQDCFLTIWHWSYKTILERNCPIMREKQLHWSDQLDHINEICVPNFLFVRFIASSSSTQGRFYLGWQRHPKISQTESI